MRLKSPVKLKACPFCGAEAVMMVFGWVPVVKCGGYCCVAPRLTMNALMACYLPGLDKKGEVWSKALRNLAERWNKRPNTPTF
jgi:hypothetical protein